MGTPKANKETDNGSKDFPKVMSVIEKQLEQDLDEVKGGIKRLDLQIKRLGELKSSKGKAVEQRRIATICMLSRKLAADYLSSFLWGLDVSAKDKNLQKKVEASLDAAVGTVRQLRESGQLYEGEGRVVQLYHRNETARFNRTIELPLGLSGFFDRVRYQRFGMVTGANVGSVTNIPLIVPYRWEQKSRSGVIAVKDETDLMAYFWQRVYVEISNFTLEVHMEAGPYKESAKVQGRAARRIYNRNRSFLESVKKEDREADSLLSDFETMIAVPLEQTRDEANAKGVFDKLQRGDADEILNRACAAYRRSLEQVSGEGARESSDRSRDSRDSRLAPQQPVDGSRNTLLKLLADLDQITDCEVIEATLEKIIATGLCPEAGTLPDSPTLRLLRRLGQLDPHRLVMYFDRLLSLPDENLPFRRGYFKTSLTGVLADNLYRRQVDDATRKAVRARFEGFATRNDRLNDAANLGVLAGLVALLIFVQENSEGATSELDQQLSRIREKLPLGAPNKAFYQLVLDMVTPLFSATGLSAHRLKVPILLKHIDEQNDTLWPRPLYTLVKDLVLTAPGKTVERAA